MNAKHHGPAVLSPRTSYAEQRAALGDAHYMTCLQRRQLDSAKVFAALVAHISYNTALVSKRYTICSDLDAKPLEANASEKAWMHFYRG